MGISRLSANASGRRARACLQRSPCTDHSRSAFFVCSPPRPAVAALLCSALRPHDSFLSHVAGMPRCRTACSSSSRSEKWWLKRCSARWKARASSTSVLLIQSALRTTRASSRRRLCARHERALCFFSYIFLALRRAVDLAGRVNWWRLLQALSIRQQLRRSARSAHYPPPARAVRSILQVQYGI